MHTEVLNVCSKKNLSERDIRGGEEEEEERRLTVRPTKGHRLAFFVFLKIKINLIEKLGCLEGNLGAKKNFE